MAKNKDSDSVKAELLKHIDEHKKQLGDDYEMIKEKITEFKGDLMSREDIKQIEDWIKMHPFLSVAFALIVGGAMHKLFSKGG